MAKYNAAQLRQMAASGAAMKDGSYPIGDAEDLSNAIHAVGRGSGDHDAIRKHIIGRAKALGKSSMIPDNWGSDGSMRAETPSAYTRAFVLDDVSIRAGGDGRTVDAYAAIFDSPSPIRDQDGEYEEVIDPSAFNRAIEHAQRSGRTIPVIFNHGLTAMGTPSDAGAMPIGVTQEIKADKRGLFTRSRYNNTPLAEAALENIREGSLTAYSFRGEFKRSDPRIPRGGFRRSGGKVPTVRRMESTLLEYGPTPFAAYPGAKVLAVRAEQAAMLLGNLASDERQRLIEMLRIGGHPDAPDLGTPDMGPAADDPPDGHSIRSPREEIRASYARFLSRRGAAQ